MTATADNRILVIGYGNTLRGDDAVGRVVADSIAVKNRADVLAISVTQLVPELSALVASARAVIFVDARVDSDGRAAEVSPLTPTCSLARGLHRTGPRELLALARTCYDRSPPAWLVTVPAHDMGYSEQFSESAQHHASQAERHIEKLIDELSRAEVGHA